METMEWWCPNCGGEGQVSISGLDLLDLDEAIYVVCSYCSHPSAHGYCEKCGIGAQLEETDFTKNPTTWICPKCKTEYKLPIDFYRRPIHFQPETFADLEKIREQKIISAYGYVSVERLKKILIFWDKHRFKPAVLFIILFVLAAIWGFISEDSGPVPLAGLFLLISLALLFTVLFIDIITSIISNMFLLIYKIRKKQE